MNKLFLLVGLTLSFPAFAHYLWIERDQDAARLFFGEYQEDIREKAGDRLDKIPAPQAWVLARGGQKRALAVEKQSNHFVLKGGAAVKQLLAEERAHEVMDLSKHKLGIVRPIYYARHWSPGGAAQPAAELDIVPHDAQARQIRAYFKNQPLANAKIMVYAPNQWMQEVKTDADGVAAIKTPWPGRYVLETVHTETAPGRFGEKDFEAIRHRATLSFVRR